MHGDDRRVWQAKSEAVEALLVRANPRGMAGLRTALKPGYLLRSTEILEKIEGEGKIGIMTGFPVAGTIETDGPAGARVLYDVLARIGHDPQIWIEGTLLDQYFPDIDGVALDSAAMPDWAAVIVIERPGVACDGRFYNIHRRDISAHCSPVEDQLKTLQCPVLAIGDGGNEIGMGLAGEALSTLPIHPAVQDCDELMIADVSNWAAYALAMMLESRYAESCSIPDVDGILMDLISRGAVDGVTAQSAPTEDNFSTADTLHVLRSIKQLLSNESLEKRGA